MPKSLDKTKGARKRKKSPANSGTNTENEVSDSKTCPKKKKSNKRRNCLDGIEMSKQLASELKRKKILRAKTSTKKNGEPRLCGNGKPMPSLAELEAMYEDSDGDENPATQITPETAPPTLERCETPEQKPLLPDTSNISSPETLKKLTSKVIDIISKTIVLDDDDDDPPPPVIPQKKRKKPDTPYIVGCKDRPQVPWAPKSKFGVDNEKYGVDPNQSPDEEEEKKRKKRGKKANLSKSIFNAKSDEIADRLKELENSSNSTPVNEQNTFFAPPSSPDSTSTVEYDYSNAPRNFSPLPSTSNDTSVFLENDRLFNKSLKIEPECLSEAITPPASPIVPQASPQAAQGSPDEVEIIEVPCETIVVDDTLPEVNVKLEKRRSFTVFDDDCCVIVEPKITSNKNSDDAKPDFPPKDDIYGSIDLTQTYDNEIYEINDDEIDDLIAENQAVLEKGRKKNSVDTVTFVDPNVIVIENESKSQQQPTALSSFPNNPTASVSQTSTSNSHPNGLTTTAVTSQTGTTNSNNSILTCHPPATIDVESLQAADHTYAVNTAVTTQPSASNHIAEVVNNFFTTQNSSSGTQVGTLDLTSAQETVLSRVSSWIFSLDSYIRRRRRSNSGEVVAIDDHPQNASNINVPNDNPPLRIYLPSNHKQDRKQHSDSSSQRRDVATNPTQTIPPHSPPRRSLGDCPICMDSLSNNAVASTICGHVFCMACIKTAIRSNGKKCPTCRKPLKGVGYHQLFL